MPLPSGAPTPARWDVLAVIVEAVEVPVPTARGRVPARVELTGGDRAAVRAELEAFRKRVTLLTGGRLAVAIHIVTVPGPLTRLSGPGPHWLAPENARPLLAGLPQVAVADTVMVFAKVGGPGSPSIPVSHLGAATGGHRVPGGACFAGITFRPEWLDGSGTVPLHEWLHGLFWALVEVSGFPEADLPDPDSWRSGARCCEDAPEGDGPFADHLVARHLTPAMIRAADARRGPVVDDGYLRRWTVERRARPGAWRTVVLPPDARQATAGLPRGVRAVEVTADAPVLVGAPGGPMTRVAGRAVVPAPGPLLRVLRAVRGAELSFRVRAATMAPSLAAEDPHAEEDVARKRAETTRR